jgi:hypothetical protein
MVGGGLGIVVIASFLLVKGGGPQAKSPGGAVEGRETPGLGT